MTTKPIINLIFGLLCSVLLPAQTLTGTLTQHQGQQISLSGFNYYTSYELAKTTVDSLGNFSLIYPKAYNGMGVLNTSDHSSLVLVLTEPNIQLTGTHLKDPNSLSFTNSVANTNFVQYAKAQDLRNNARYALNYLEGLYQKEPLFAKRKTLKTAIKNEQAYLQKEDAAFIAQLAPQSFLGWFIPYRKLVQDMPTIVQNETQRITEAITQFRTTDFNHPKFKTSGLFKELIEGHYMLLKNMGQSVDSINAQMNLSTQYLIDNLQENDSLLNTVSNALFNYFEKFSLFNASEHLSMRLLNDNQCVLEDDLAVKLERYRAMKVGNTAAEISLKNDKKLSNLKANKLLVFGVSWCQHCTNDLPTLVENYKKFKDKNVEIVYISLDTDQAAFNNTYKDVPWQHTLCDFKGWDTQAAKDYFVSSTPTYFLLDANNEILARPNNAEHARVLIDHRL